MTEDNIVEVPELTALIPQPKKRGRGRPPKHGAYSKFALNALTDTKIQEIKDVMADARMALAPSDALYINMLGRLLAQMTLIDRYLAEYGLFEDEGRGLIRPVVPQYLNLAKQASRMLEQLGMTSTSRYKLGRDLVATQKDFAAMLQEAREE